MLVRALERGLTISDFDLLTVGMVLDYIIEYNRLHSEQKDPVRTATQGDFDGF